MKSLALFMLLCGAAGAATAGPETLLTCADVLPPTARWTATGADTMACRQTVVGAGIDSALVGRNAEKMGAFRNNVLIAIRPADEPNPAPVNAPVYQAGEWLETGSTGVPGELWWGRTATRHIFVGQESHIRLTKLSALVPASARPALQDFLMRRMMSAVQQQPMQRKPGDERFRLFGPDRIVYTQHAATTATFDEGLGGDGKIPPGKVSNARLELATTPVVKGTLQFDLVIDGQVRQFTMPLQADSELHHLRARRSNDDKAPACNGQWAALSVNSSDCPIVDGVHFRELYDATGAFFGDHAAYTAVHFRLRVNSPSRNRNGATAMGVIVLKAP